MGESQRKKWEESDHVRVRSQPPPMRKRASVGFPCQRPDALGRLDRSGRSLLVRICRQRVSTHPRRHFPGFVEVGTYLGFGRAAAACLELAILALVDVCVRARMAQVAVPEDNGRVRFDHLEHMGAVSWRGHGGRRTRSRGRRERSCVAVLARRFWALFSTGPRGEEEEAWRYSPRRGGRGGRSRLDTRVLESEVA